jgi:hypothetical protein
MTLALANQPRTDGFAGSDDSARPERIPPATERHTWDMGAEQRARSSVAVNVPFAWRPRV